MTTSGKTTGAPPPHVQKPVNFLIQGTRTPNYMKCEKTKVVATATKDSGVEPAVVFQVRYFGL